jgi:putative phosphonate metabolism protein
MRYAIHFTPSPNDPLTHAAAAWLGRDVYSGQSVEPPPSVLLGMQEISYHTALPRRYGFHGTLKAPFRLAEGVSEAALLRELMCFAGTHQPFSLPPLEIAKLGNIFGLVPEWPCETLNFLAASVVQEFDMFRAPLSEAEIDRADPDRLSASQLTNLHRWGHPYVMDEFRFQMVLTGGVMPADCARVERAVRGVFQPLLDRTLEFSNLALFVEDEPGAPFRVHSLHPMGRVSARRIA